MKALPYVRGRIDEVKTEGFFFVVNKIGRVSVASRKKFLSEFDTDVIVRRRTDKWKEVLRSIANFNFRKVEKLLEEEDTELYYGEVEVRKGSGFLGTTSTDITQVECIGSRILIQCGDGLKYCLEFNPPLLAYKNFSSLFS